ncbi:MAG: hypothetical protein ACLFTK_10730 [Anaerolineales bacterium]
MKHIVLLDMDGVLIAAYGYREATRATLRALAEKMSQPDLLPPTDDEMLAFEAQSIIFEWDSIALMAASLFEQVPLLHAETVHDTVAAIAEAGVTLQRPDWRDFARSCPPPTPEQPSAAQIALGRRFPATALYTDLLATTHAPEAWLTRLFQCFVLGAEQFQQTYSQPAIVQTPSLLQSHDQAVLSVAWRDELISRADTHPVIYTARPSLPPHFAPDVTGYPPEAEIGQRLLGLHSVPLVAYGHMAWLAAEQQTATDAFVKPALMHSRLAVMRALAPDDEQAAIDMALGLQAIPAEWLNAPWRIIVCEDSTASIRGVQATVAALRVELEHDIVCSAVGIAEHPENVASLGTVADHVAPDVNAGLKWALGI